MKKKRPDPIDWHKIRTIMAKSVRGTMPSDEDMQLLKQAHSHDGKTYGELSHEVRQEAQTELARAFRS